MPDIEVYPISRADARTICASHPHAGTLPNSSKYYLAAKIDGRLAGLAVWGWGIMPRETPKHLFGDAAQIADYLELTRFFVYDWTPKNTASKFLAITHRLIRKHVPSVRWLYTYAAGFQGMVGGIYKAANYTYIGKTLCNSFIYIPSVGLVHNIALWHRYGVINGSNDKSLGKLQKFIPGARRWCGWNFRYVYFQGGAEVRDELMKTARFQIEPYPQVGDMDIWLENVGGEREPVSLEMAKTVPIVKLPTKRAESIGSDAPAIHAGEGGANPTSALQT